MCLLLLSIKSHPVYKLIVAFNRDEYYDRPTAPAAFWEDEPDFLGGKDLRAGGTWLEIARNGRIGVITNYCDPASIKDDALSRGKLVSNFLLSQQTAVDYLDGLIRDEDMYNGFNIILGERDRIYWYSNRGNRPRNLLPGIYGLSNHLLDTPWSKVIRGKDAISNLLSRLKAPSPEDIFQILQDRSISPDESFADLEFDRELESLLLPIFVSSPTFGTRSSTLLLIDQRDYVTFIERTFDAEGNNAGTKNYEFQIET